VFSTPLLTFLGVHRKRGVDATDDFGIAPRFRGTLVHDRWAPYWRYVQALHAICCAHLLRDLDDVAEIAGQRSWAEAMAELLVEAKRKCDAARAAARGRLAAAERAAIRARYDAIVADALAVNPEPNRRKRTKIERVGYNLAVALRDHAEEVLRFTADLAVPFDNNQGERDLRMAKLVMKISGCFRTPAGAERFAKVRSYIETGRKHGENPLDLLTAVFTGQPWMIPSPAS
jgi:transposase